MMVKRVTVSGKRARARWQIHVAASTVLSDPGPSSIAVAVVTPDGRRRSLRSWYLGVILSKDAEQRALEAGQMLAAAWKLPRPIFYTTSRELAASGGRDVRYCATTRNQALIHSLIPVMRWLPEREQRGASLEVRPVNGGRFLVASESEPGRFYLVDPQVGRCECKDRQYRSLPCKHLICVSERLGISPLRVVPPRLSTPSIKPSLPMGIGAALSRETARRAPRASCYRERMLAGGQ
jgi:hypothetical protein